MPYLITYGAAFQVARILIAHKKFEWSARGLIFLSLLYIISFWSTCPQSNFVENFQFLFFCFGNASKIWNITISYLSQSHFFYNEPLTKKFENFIVTMATPHVFIASIWLFTVWHLVVLKSIMWFSQNRKDAVFAPTRVWNECRLYRIRSPDSERSNMKQWLILYHYFCWNYGVKIAFL